MSGRLVVKRYARALYEAAMDAGKLEEIRKDMAFIENVLTEAPEIKAFCLESRGNRQKEKLFVTTAFIPYVGTHTARMLEILSENSRLAAIPYIPMAYSVYEDSLNGIIPLEIESAGELEEETREAIELKIGQRLSKKCRTTVRIKKLLIGGFTISWNNRMIDMSLKGRLNKMRRLLS
jgi:F-type H+-transporting ATPase subunit delta